VGGKPSIKTLIKVATARDKWWILI
jgi:hypothetical protein